MERSLRMNQPTQMKRELLLSNKKNLLKRIKDPKKTKVNVMKKKDQKVRKVQRDMKESQ